LPQELVGILVCATLPRLVGVAEVDFDVRRQGKAMVTGEWRSLHTVDEDDRAD